jgi:hypothetical protein
MSYRRKHCTPRAVSEARMPGPFPKFPEQRRNRTTPARGEWVELEPLKEPVLPAYRSEWRVFVAAKDKNGDAIRVRRGVSRPMWEAWRRSPVTSQFGPEDVAAACYLAEAFHTLSDASRLALMDRLGFTPRGKRDLRWRTPGRGEDHRRADAGQAPPPDREGARPAERLASAVAAATC